MTRPSTHVTCFLRYIIVPSKIADFEQYASLWMSLVENYGGRHHGYFLPSEGANNVALALFTFPSLAAYESYRMRSYSDEECREAYAYAERTGCIVSYERSFLYPLQEVSSV